MTLHTLLLGPLAPDSGLDIGLYQVACCASVCGFTLALAQSEDDKVCFVLSGAPKPAAPPG